MGFGVCTRGLPVGWGGVEVCARERDNTGRDIRVGL